MHAGAINYNDTCWQHPLGVVLLFRIALRLVGPSSDSAHHLVARQPKEELPAEDPRYNWPDLTSFSTHSEVFNPILVPFIGEVMFGHGATAFAYGPSDAGNVHTMEGAIEKSDTRWEGTRQIRARSAC